MIKNQSNGSKISISVLGIGVTMVILGASLSLMVFLYSFGVGNQTLDFSQLLKDFRVGAILYVAGQQAFMSCFVSFCLAVPISSILAKRYHWHIFPPLFGMLGLVLVMPTTVAAVGILKVWGLNGWLAQTFDIISFGTVGWVNIYGLHGVVLAHVFFNLPLMIRVLTPIFLSFPKEHIFLSEQYGFSRVKFFWVLEWPAIKRVALSLNVLVFLLCFTSFSLVLMLGGGPKVTTLEVEIYSAIRFDFSIAKAAALSLIQVAIVACVIFILTFFENGLSNNSAIYLPLGNRLNQEKFPRAPLRNYNKGIVINLIKDIFWLAPLIFIIFLPFFAVILSGFSESLIKVLKWEIFWESLKNTILIAFLSSSLAISLGFLLAYSKVILRSSNFFGRNFFLGLIESSILIYLAIPAIVLGTALFIVLRKFADVVALSWLILVLSNVFLCLPFVVRIIEPRLFSLESKHKTLYKSLGLVGAKKFFSVTLPGLNVELGLALGIALAFSVGDLSVIALFGSNDFQTIPWLIYQTAGRYGLSDANALALLLLVVTFFFFFCSKFLVQKVCSISVKI